MNPRVFPAILTVLNLGAAVARVYNDVYETKPQPGGVTGHNGPSPISIVIE